MTIHRVNEKYDEGEIVFQAATAIDPAQDQPEDIAARVLELEHRYYPEVVEHLIKDGK
jgi:phosphoribosylglycinamide formyltransferase-1